MKIRPSYTDVMIDAVKSVVTFGGPLNVIIMILYNKTKYFLSIISIFECAKVVEIMDVISLCMQ